MAIKGQKGTCVFNSQDFVLIFCIININIEIKLHTIYVNINQAGERVIQSNSQANIAILKSQPHIIQSWNL
jgi:hypothetical protein